MSKSLQEHRLNQAQIWLTNNRTLSYLLFYFIFYLAEKKYDCRCVDTVVNPVFFLSFGNNNCLFCLFSFSLGSLNKSSRQALQDNKSPNDAINYIGLILFKHIQYIYI
jgi:hypothetical protein